MSNNLHKFQEELLSEIKDILLSEWNPVGGEDVPRNEYDSYALRIFGIIQRQFRVKILELKMFYNDPAFSKTEKIQQDDCTIADFLYKTEKDMGLDGNIERCRKVSQIVEKTAERYNFQMKLALMQSHLANVIEEQDKQIKNKNPVFSYLKGSPDPSLLAIFSFVEDLLKIDWQTYNIDQNESFVEELTEPIGYGGLLRVCIKHADKTIKTYTYKKKEEEVFIEIVLGNEGTINYPGGHSHCDYYDYSDGKYVENNETIELIKDMLSKGLTIKYVFRGDDLIGSGIWDDKIQGFWMNYGINFKIFNPVYWAKKLLGKLEKREEIVTISWKKLP